MARTKQPNPKPYMNILIYALIHVVGAILAYRTAKLADKKECPTRKLNRHDIFAYYLVSIVGSWLTFICALLMLWDYTYQRYTNYESRNKES